MKKFSISTRTLIIPTICLGLTAIASGQTFTTLLSFDGPNGTGGHALVQGFDGNLYSAGAIGAYNKGNVFRVSSSGQVTSLYSFCPQKNCTDGWAPRNLVLGADGNFYGTTLYGGSYTQSDCGTFGCGTVFKITPAGKLTTLHAFCTQSGCLDGETPQSALVLGADGNLYGTTVGGGTSGGGGTVFRITPAGALTTLYSFSFPDSPNGYYLQSGVTFGSNGNLFGAANYGGSHQEGTLFELTPNGQLKVVYNFNLSSNSDGAYVNGFELASDGNVYATDAGGAFQAGNILRVTEGGKVSIVYTFCSQVNCTDGTTPFAPVIQGTDGNLYGTTSAGGGTKGTLYQTTLTGNFTMLHAFCSQSGCADGAQPYSALVQATNGLFYGTASQGGTSTYCGTNTGCGTLFSLSMGLSPFAEVVPTAGKVGQVINILGNNLSGATSVTFNGVAAQFKVMTNTHLKAQVPTGASTGTIEVTTPSGTLVSNIAFHVAQ